MKNLYWAVAGISLCLTLSWACAPLLPYPTADALLRAQAGQPQLTLQDLDIGRRLYAAHCANCHRLHLPSELAPEAWDKIMLRMQKKAKIDDVTTGSISAYLLAMDKVEKNDPD